VRDRAVEFRLNRLDGNWNEVVNVKRLRIDRKVAEVAEAAIEGENGAAVDGLKNNGVHLAGTA
jgi:hypothetical protein